LALKFISRGKCPRSIPTTPVQDNSMKSIASQQEELNQNEHSE
jgi:hypothetical protein